MVSAGGGSLYHGCQSKAVRGNETKPISPNPNRIHPIAAGVGVAGGVCGAGVSPRAAASGQRKWAIGEWEWIGCWLAGWSEEPGDGGVAPAGRKARATSGRLV